MLFSAPGYIKNLLLSESGLLVLLKTWCLGYIVAILNSSEFRTCSYLDSGPLFRAGRASPGYCVSPLSYDFIMIIMIICEPEIFIRTNTGADVLLLSGPTSLNEYYPNEKSKPFAHVSKLHIFQE